MRTTENFMCDLQEYEKDFNKAIKNFIHFIPADVININIYCKKSLKSINYKVIEERKIIID